MASCGHMEHIKHLLSRPLVNIFPETTAQMKLKLHIHVPTNEDSRNCCMYACTPKDRNTYGYRLMILGVY